MPIARPRRIFRSGIIAARTNRRGVTRTFLAGVIGVLSASAIVAIALPANLFGRVPALTGTVSADAQHVAVVDGDTLRLRETVVRLLGVSAPKRGAPCRPGTDCAAAATDALAALVRDRGVVCTLDGRDPTGFPQARCEANGRNINHAIVALGYAHAGAGAETLAGDEAQARANRLGLWHDGSF